VAWLGLDYLAVVYNLILFAALIFSARLAPSIRDLRVQRSMDPVLSVRASNRIELVVENDGDEPIVGQIRDEAPPFFETDRREFPIRIEPGDRREFSYHVTPPERGSTAFPGTYLRVELPFGLATRDFELPTAQEVRVYPNLIALREFDLLKQQGRLREIGIRRTRQRGIGSEFESLRDYTQGDDFRKIDHKASARRGKLVVRQFETERNQTVMLVIDVGRHMLSEVNGVRKLDHVLDSILMLTHAAALAGDQVGLLVYSDTVRRYIPPRKGRGQQGAIIDACHDLVAEPVESDVVGAYSYLSSRWKRRSLLVAFTDYDDADRARDLLTAFLPISRRHVALMVRVQDPKLDEVYNRRTETTQDLYAKAAAGMLLDDIKAANARFTAAGLHLLESEPQNLAAGLVNYYFTVKERGLI